MNLSINDICEKIENGKNLYEICNEESISYSELYRYCMAEENIILYNESRKIYIQRMADLTESRFNNSTTAAANTFLNALKILRPEVYNNNIEEKGASEEIEIEL